MRAVKVFICLYAVLAVNQHVAFESLRKRGQHEWEGGDVMGAEHVPHQNVCIMKSRRANQTNSYRNNDHLHKQFMCDINSINISCWRFRSMRLEKPLGFIFINMLNGMFLYNWRKPSFAIVHMKQLNLEEIMISLSNASLETGREYYFAYKDKGSC